MPTRFILLFCLCFASGQISAQQQDTIYIVDKIAKFPGGDRAFSIYWQKAFKIPFKYKLKPPSEEGEIAFYIFENGDIGKVFIKKPLNSDLDEAALKAVKKMPRWEPATRNGKPVGMGFTYSYFVINSSTEGSVDLDENQKKAMLRRNRGLEMSLWLGPTARTGTLAKHLKPASVTLSSFWLMPETAFCQATPPSANPNQPNKNSCFRTPEGELHLCQKIQKSLNEDENRNPRRSPAVLPNARSQNLVRQPNGQRQRRRNPLRPAENHPAGH